jgi:hypothetical protein
MGGVRALAAQLSGGDRRSIGHSDEVASQVLADPALFGELIEAISDDDPLVRMRAADAAEKVSAQQPRLLGPFKRKLIGEIAQLPQPEVRWHFCQMAPRLDLTARERQTVFDLMVSFLNDDSRIVRTFSIQGMADLAEQDRALRASANAVIDRMKADPSPAVRARCRKLLAALSAPSR